ncbi:hypothetical protein CPB83DRAFT_861656 [Crepidotus variabilis]|uniref:Uncharacterized protein n=1 Tax=Crepidotus variabilis TaxID=179855 RepID=A0A9P6E8D6_9AGAR|nr:hypothetical protein CPB83DRAFT_861656 [Crepidotus variabilis]
MISLSFTTSSTATIFHHGFDVYEMNTFSTTMKVPLIGSIILRVFAIRRARRDITSRNTPS